MKIFTVKENCTLKEFTDSAFPQGAFALNALLKKRDIKVNGVRVGRDTPLSAGDTVAYYTTPRQESLPTHTVVYEDENLLVCDKFSGVTSEGLLSELNEGGGIYAVHRLDRNTQGLIVYAKTAEAAEELQRAFREKRVDKIYLALCKDGFALESAVLRGYLIKDAKSARVSVSDDKLSGGEPIVTEYCVLERKNGLALVRVILHTGKTHQIRAHLAHIGCPLLGDEKYGDGALNAQYGARRQRLVAKRLKFHLDGKLGYLNGLEWESGFFPEP